jgi:hypothetical protein
VIVEHPNLGLSVESGVKITNVRVSHIGNSFRDNVSNTTDGVKRGGASP